MVYDEENNTPPTGSIDNDSINSEKTRINGSKGTSLSLTKGYVKEFTLPATAALTTAAGLGWTSAWLSDVMIESAQELTSHAGEIAAEIIGVGIWGAVSGIGIFTLAGAAGVATYYAQNTLSTCKISDRCNPCNESTSRYDRM